MKIAAQTLDSIQMAIDVLKKGGIVAHATDTCYGFASSINSKEGIAKLYQLKKMNDKRPVSILISSLEEAKKYSQWNETAETLARAYWPGALTIVLKRAKALPLYVNPDINTIGLRLPDHELSITLARQLGCPITTTSANITGKPSPYSVQEIISQFENESVGAALMPHLLLDSGTLDRTIQPSTIADCSTGKIVILRQGSLIISL